MERTTHMVTDEIGPGWSGVLTAQNRDEIRQQIDTMLRPMNFTMIETGTGYRQPLVVTGCSWRHQKSVLANAGDGIAIYVPRLYQLMPGDMITFHIRAVVVEKMFASGGTGALCLMQEN